MFWEHQTRDLSFNYDQYNANKDTRDKKHFDKMGLYEVKKNEAQQIVDQLLQAIDEKDAQI